MSKDGTNVYERFFETGEPKKRPKKVKVEVEKKKGDKGLEADMAKIDTAMPSMIAMRRKIRRAAKDDAELEKLYAHVDGVDFIITANLLYDVMRVLDIDPVKFQIDQTGSGKSMAAMGLIWAYIREHQSLTKGGK